jgi:hypothetical protein
MSVEDIIQYPSCTNRILVADLPFGGVNVIVCGDQYPFPPLAAGAHGTLYHDNYLNVIPEISLGRMIYEKFKTMVVLLLFSLFHADQTF